MSRKNTKTKNAEVASAAFNAEGNKTTNAEYIKVVNLTELDCGGVDMEYEPSDDCKADAAKWAGVEKANDQQIGEFILKILESGIDRYENALEEKLLEKTDDAINSAES